MFKKVVLVSRILLGLMFIMAGADGVMRALTGKGFFPEPTLSPEMMTVMGGLVGLKYLFPLAKIIELVAGILFVWGRYLNLAIVLLTPVMINILGINLFVDRTGAPMALGLFVLLLIVIRDRWSYFKALLCEK